MVTTFSQRARMTGFGSLAVTLAFGAVLTLSGCQSDDSSPLPPVPDAAADHTTPSSDAKATADQEAPDSGSTESEASAGEAGTDGGATDSGSSGDAASDSSTSHD